MEKKISISNVRSSYAKRVESNVRNFNSYVREVLKDWDAIHAPELTQIEIAAAAEAKKAAAEAKKANASAEAKQKASEAKQKAEAAAKRAAEAREAQQKSSSEAREELRAICARYNLKREDISLAFLKEFSFYANSKGIICDAKRIEIEAEAEARAKFTEYEFKENSKSVIYMLIPVKIWSASKLLQKITSAAAAREAAKKAESAAEREKAAAEREEKRIEAYRKRVADFDAKRAAAEQQSAAAAEQQSAAAAEQQSK